MIKQKNEVNLGPPVSWWGNNKNKPLGNPGPLVSWIGTMIKQIGFETRTTRQLDWSNDKTMRN